MRPLALPLLLLWSSPVMASEASGSAESADCTAAIATAERDGGIPAGLLAAIGQVESGRMDPVSGTVRPWPWTINAAGIDHFFASKAGAVAAVTALRARGVASIDVGCLQVNLMHHPAAFANLEEAFDPLANALYAARFLNQLFSGAGDWSAAAAAYHSKTLEIGAAYKEKVLAAWTPTGPTLPPAAGPRSRGFVTPDWINAADLGRREPPAPQRQATPPAGPSSVPPSALLERIISMVAGCSAGIEGRPPTDDAPPYGFAAWEAPDTCPSSPFAKPAALRRLMAQP
jgi:hypothetical protein